MKADLKVRLDKISKDILSLERQYDLLSANKQWDLCSYIYYPAQNETNEAANTYYQCITEATIAETSLIQEHEERLKRGFKIKKEASPILNEMSYFSQEIKKELVRLNNEFSGKDSYFVKTIQPFKTLYELVGFNTNILRQDYFIHSTVIKIKAAILASQKVGAVLLDKLDDGKTQELAVLKEEITSLEAGIKELDAAAQKYDLIKSTLSPHLEAENKRIFPEAEKEFIAALNSLKLKAIDLTQRSEQSPSYKKANAEAERMIKAIEDAGDKFFTKKTITLDTFFKRCRLALLVGRKELSQHRGWAEAIGSFLFWLISIASLGTAPLASRVMNGQWRFFEFTTQSETESTQFNLTLKKMGCSEDSYQNALEQSM